MSHDAVDHSKDGASEAQPGALPRSTIRVLIADDHHWIREGVRYAFEGTEIEIVGEATTGAEAIRLARLGGCDVMLLDLNMPEGDGFTVLETLRTQPRETRILVYSNHDRSDYRHRARRLDASGFLLKTVDRGGLIDAVRKLGRGGSLWDAPQPIEGRRPVATGTMETGKDAKGCTYDEVGRDGQ